MIAYKGFSKDWKCRDFQFEVGKTYKHEGSVRACESGFHSCEYPLDVFGYYPPAESKYAIVHIGGETHSDGGDTKIASAEIIIKTEIGIPEIVKRSVEWIMGRVTLAEDAATNTGDRSVATNTGDRSVATNTGSRSAASNTGYRSAATNTGNYSAATNTGNYSAATNTGNYSAATNTGYQSAATNTGYRSVATNTGDRSAATNTGDQSAATNTGDRSVATNTGSRSAALVEGKHSVAIATGSEGLASASKTGAIVLVYRDPDDGAIKHIFASKVGESGIKADVLYRLNAEGKPEAVE
jgi:hypothetical protein